jgi:hypothetical protein
MGIINIIYDCRYAPQDKERLIREFSEQGIIGYKFWDAIVLNNSIVDSIAASHKMIVQDAKDRGLKGCIIAEQDLTFTCPTAWEYFIGNKPKEFDIYLASTYVLPVSNNKICGFHLYIIHEKFYDTLLSVSNGQHIDTACCNLGGDFKFCYPFPALQRAGFSANSKTEVDYNSLLKPEDIYKG